MNYTLTDDATWLSESPTTGSSTGEHDTITVNYATSSLAIGTHTATITISDSGSTNTPQTIGVTLTVTAVPGDFNADGHIDHTDVNTFKACMTGPEVSPSSGCSGADLDNDGDVDEADFGLLQRCLSGPVNAPDPYVRELSPLPWAFRQATESAAQRLGKRPGEKMLLDRSPETGGGLSAEMPGVPTGSLGHVKLGVGLADHLFDSKVVRMVTGE